MNNIEAIESLVNGKSKKEIVEQARSFALNELENGTINDLKNFADVMRMKTLIDTVYDVFKEHLEAGEGHGVTIETKNGRSMPQYENDPVYKSLKQQLKDREELLKTALKSKTEIADAETGEIVPKVPVFYAKDSKSIKLK